MRRQSVRTGSRFGVLLSGLVSVCLVACASPVTPPPATAYLQSGRLFDDVYQTPDGARLPLRQWRPAAPQALRAVLIAVHGFNDYSHFFAEAGAFFSRHAVHVYAYDQRGFGAAPGRGFWHGTDTYVRDLHALIELVQRRHPAVPLFVLGESMGGAVVINLLARFPSAPLAGAILCAPAIWARQTMPWYQTAALWTLVHVAPQLKLTGSGLGYRASDNDAVLRALAEDPFVIKATRVDAIAGLTDLMDAAWMARLPPQPRLLVLYGENDQIIPAAPSYRYLQRLWHTPRAATTTLALYAQGYHLLLRDLHAPTVWRDILSWLDNPVAPLPSGADRYALAKFAALTDKD